MADVIRIAKERRTRLVSEIAKLDSFIRMADVLVKYEQGLNNGSVLGVDPTSAATLLVDCDQAAHISHLDESLRGTVTAPTIVKTNNVLETAAIDAGALKIPPQSGSARDNSGVYTGTQSITVFPTSPDHFAFNDKTSAGEEELVLDNPLADNTASVDAHVGQKMRQRRWMMGMTQQQLGDFVGVKFDQIQKYETGAIHIDAGRMWDIAAAMEVPMSYFFEGIEGKAADTGEARGDIPADDEALAMAQGGTQARNAQAS